MIVSTKVVDLSFFHLRPEWVELPKSAVFAEPIAFKLRLPPGYTLSVCLEMLAHVRVTIWSGGQRRHAGFDVRHLGGHLVRPDGSVVIGLVTSQVRPLKDLDDDATLVLVHDEGPTLFFSLKPLLWAA